jgi:sn-glycerol 3-phosphate transport system permease protein
VRKPGQAFLYLLPTLLFLVAFTYVPMLYSVVQGGPRIAEVIQGRDVGNSLRATLIYLALVVPGSVVLGLVSAMAVRGKSRVQLVARAILFHPVILPMVAFAAIWLYLMNPTSGPFTELLVSLTNRNVQLLGDPSLTLYSVALVGVLKDFGLYMLFFLAGLQSIPNELLEAASIDGANWFTRFMRVTLPLLAPTTFYVSVIALLWTLRNVDHIYVLTPRGGVFGETELWLFRIYQVAFEYYDLARASALSIFLFVALIVVALIAIPRIEKGIYYADPN